jgi:hypothetical protein
MRRVRPLLILVTVAIGTLSSAAVANETSGHAAASVTKAQALTFANDVNLTAADVPGSATTAPAKEEGPRPNDVTFARCTGGLSPDVAVLDRDSAKLRVAGSELGSSAVVYPTSAQATENFDAVRARRGQACLRRLLTEDLNKQASDGAHYSATTLTTLPSVLSGGQQSFGVRVAVTISVPTHKTRVFIDAYDVLVGPAEVNLTVVRTEQPPPTTIERRLFSLLDARAEYHEL